MEKAEHRDRSIMAKRIGGEFNLTGVWRGLYSYPIKRAPVPFTASVNESGCWITGATEEVATARAAFGRTLTATLQGRRSGSSVRFLKLYDCPMRVYDSVAYEGSVNAEGTEIEGRWTVPGNWSGKFLMIREGEIALTRARTVKEKV